jgi:hypothetical protein
MCHIERVLKKLRLMVGNKARVEGCITEELKLKEIAYFTSVYFVEHHNVNAPTMRYHVEEDIPCRPSNFSMEGYNCWCLHDIPANSGRQNVCFALLVLKYG